MILNKTKNKLNFNIKDSNISSFKFYLKENYNSVNYDLNCIIRENDVPSIKESDLSAKAHKIQATTLKKDQIIELISKFIIQIEGKDS